MADAEEYVSSEARYAQQVEEASGARHQTGMAPYPLYGIGDDPTPVLLPIWERPWFAYGVGIAAGIGAGYAVWGWLLPLMRGAKKSSKKNVRSKKKKEAEEDDDE